MASRQPVSNSLAQTTRRSFLLSTLVGVAAAAKGAMTSQERVDRCLAGKDLDRPPISLWHHFGLERERPRSHADATLSFHRDFGTDLVKVMSDFPYPKPSGDWWELREEPNPFPQQIEALGMIQAGLHRQAYFVETVFNPWTVAEKLSSKEEVQRLKQEQPQRLLDALEVIAKSESNHARKAIQTGARGIFLAIANAEPPTLSREDYLKLSAPFDKIILEAVKNEPLNTLHIHGAKVYLDLFQSGWPSTVLNYSVATTGIPLATTRSSYTGVLAGGIDEVNYRSLTQEQIRQQAEKARAEAGRRFFLTPGCSVPNDSTAEELRHLRAVYS